MRCFAGPDDDEVHLLTVRWNDLDTEDSEWADEDGIENLLEAS